MYALVEIKGKQYKAQQDGKLTVDLIEAEKGKELEFDSVLLLKNETDLKIGAPYVKNAKIKAVVEDHIKGDKIIIYKYKKRKAYNRKNGHRQNYTVLKVTGISG